VNARSVLLAEHALTHTTAVATADGTQLAESLWARLNESRMRERLPGHNSIAWILWHLARVEDVYVNCLIRGVPEVLDRDAWLRRLNVDVRDIGTGASDEDVADLSARIDLLALRAYRDAVGRETRSWLEEANLDQLDAVVDVPGRMASARPFLGERADWVRSSLGSSGSGASLWHWPIIGHGFAHLGEASHVVRSLGLPGR